MRLERRAVVTIAALDVRKRPDHRAELGSQLLCGEMVTVLSRTDGGRWWRIVGRTDGYRGWARSWGLSELPVPEADAWARAARARLEVPYATVRERPAGGAVLAPVYLHSRLAPMERRGEWRQVRLPDGRIGWLEERDLAMGRPRPRPIEVLVGDLLGVPYLWGGRTPMGFDCSGFVQQAMAGRNVSLPRDAEDQWRSVRRVRAGRARQGDLVFFGPPRGRVAHVGLLMGGGGGYAHARGCVRINSFDPSNPLFDNELAAMVRGFGRPGAGG